MELDEEQRRRVASLIDAYRELRDAIPEDTEDDCEWHRRCRYEAMLVMAGHVLVALGVDGRGLL